MVHAKKKKYMGGGKMKYADGGKMKYKKEASSLILLETEK